MLFPVEYDSVGSHDQALSYYTTPSSVEVPIRASAAQLATRRIHNMKRT